MKKLKKLIIYIVAVACIVAVVDVIVDHYMRRHVKSTEMPGDYRSLDYLLKNFDEDILILGSSVALNSLNPVAIEDSLTLTTYNGASNGQTFTYPLVILKSIPAEHRPKAVLLGIKPEDLSTDGAGARINFLSPYFGLGYESIDSVLMAQTKVPLLMSHSSLLRFNTIWFRILLYHVKEPGVKGDKGFIAKDIPSIFPKMKVEKTDGMIMSDQRRGELQEFIDICKSNDIKLILFFPPRYVSFENGLHSTPLYKEAKEIIENSDMILYDDTNCPAIISDSTLYYDNNHLNRNGSEVYTEFFINRIKNDSIL